SFNHAFSEHCWVLDKSMIDSEWSAFSVSIPRIEINQSSNQEDNFSIVLSENSPECCAFGKCSNCCTGDSCSSEKGYPVILVHGHLAYNRNSPELVINSFSDMQSSMESIGYIPAGLLDLNVNVPPNDWGRSTSPIAVRASYYYISYYDLGFQTVESQKTDSIENYAIRLREIVEEVKRRTGSDKVIIIAHSMGGLVAREYLLLFGEESVDKMITIGTPNKGIEGALVEICPIFGSEKECSDMAKNSIFLKRLNDERNSPKSVRMYTIAATGCNTYGKDGDGVVAADNVALDFALNYRISGNCTDILKSNLHGMMLIPEEYPETFKIVSSILRE
ncbi:MAG: alpha/beta fold hydrolase, partial [Candidatus Woesearchaeota archaeon]|nr:alpha/beta fold hydrolase [Candidatus Woesearchaeota archaeon]